MHVRLAGRGRSSNYAYLLFSKSSKPKKDVAERVNTVLGYEAIGIVNAVRIVRDVAPNKLMMCAEFQLSRRTSGSSGKRKIPILRRMSRKTKESLPEKRQKVASTNNTNN